MSVQPMTVDEFVNRITKPMYVYRMAKAAEKSAGAAMRKSAGTRVRKAKAEIDGLIREYMRESGS